MISNKFNAYSNYFLILKSFIKHDFITFKLYWSIILEHNAKIHKEANDYDNGDMKTISKECYTTQGNVAMNHSITRLMRLNANRGAKMSSKKCLCINKR
jgi:hypothetical protein